MFQDRGVPPRPTEDHLIVNEMIREYLEFNGYKHTLSTFLEGKFHLQQRMIAQTVCFCSFSIVEAQQPVAGPQVQRGLLAHRLGIRTQPPRRSGAPPAPLM